MSGRDAELDQIRDGVNCAVVLERQAPAWQLDRRASTRRALKYRRGDGEVIIVNHDGRGWWDTQSSAKGDIFDLAQHLDPGLNFGQVRKALRPFVGLSPTYPEAPDRAVRGAHGQAPAERWASRRRLRPGCAGWTYLTAVRRIPGWVLAAAERQDAVRDGFHGSAWFAHRDAAGTVSHVECRGVDFRGSLAGGSKTLFRLRGGSQPACRLALAEAPIDALSLAALEGMRADTIYAATGGGMGPGTIEAIEATLCAMSAMPGAVLCSAADANAPGDRYAERHAGLAAAAGVAFGRLRPTAGADWNDILREEREP